MSYKLVVLTHGPDWTFLERTIRSFREMVTPAPSSEILVVDGWHQPPADIWDGARFSTFRQVGFCEATRIAWNLGSTDDGHDFVFHLEHDFVFLRPVDLEIVAEALWANLDVAQMSFMRQPVNSVERKRGVLPSGSFVDRGGWLMHREYVTTNPSLMRRDFMEHYPWPLETEECEGKYGLQLRENGWSFGVWGSGDQWVEHIGVRTGHGY